MVQAQYDYSKLWDEPVAPPSVKQVKKTYKKVNHKGKILVKLTICFFIYALVLVFLCIKGATLGYQIVALEDEINFYETQNARLQYNIQEASSLDKVEYIAINELGMYKPEKHLSVAFTTPRVNQVQENEVTDDKVVEVAEKPLYKIYTNILLLAEKN